jgi:hypothetical protein
MKLARITDVLMLKSMENNCTFSTLSFMKDKLCNWLGHHLDTIVYAFLHNSFLLKKKNPLSKGHYKLERSKNAN